MLRQSSAVKGEEDISLVEHVLCWSEHSGSPATFLKGMVAAGGSVAVRRPWIQYRLTACQCDDV
jgi:hypothetical protein